MDGRDPEAFTLVKLDKTRYLRVNLVHNHQSRSTRRCRNNRQSLPSTLPNLEMGGGNKGFDEKKGRRGRTASGDNPVGWIRKTE